MLAVEFHFLYLNLLTKAVMLKMLVLIILGRVVLEITVLLSFVVWELNMSFLLPYLPPQFTLKKNYYVP